MVFWVVFLGIYLNSKEKKIRAWVDVSDILFLFGGGEGESEEPVNENPRGGGASRKKGAGSVSAGNWKIFLGGGGVNILFRCRDVHQVFVFGINSPKTTFSVT